MNLFQELSTEDVDLIHRYIDQYGDSEYSSGALPRSEMSHFLRFWNDNKASFYKMFGNQMIIKKEVVFEQSHNELMERMDTEFYGYGHDDVLAFINQYKIWVGELDFPSSIKYLLRSFVDDYDMLLENVYTDDAFLIPGHMTKNGKPLQINHGCKAVKMLGKIVEAVGLSQEGYEAFRRAHSLVLNQKTIKGNLCLSIHPLDYITMSDNNCGWSSCMQWVDEAGDYRLGTIEMMNSPYVIIAYLESRDNMEICGSCWNNKRWRQLYVVTPDLILGNRQYPYENDYMQGIAIKWVRQLAMDNLRWGPFPEEACQIMNRRWNPIGSRDIRFDLNFDYMYNDIYDKRMGYLSLTYDKSEFELNLSGPAVCVACGDVIPYETVDADTVRCRECLGQWRCDCCGDWTCGESYDVDDELYCDYCYHHELHACEICGERTRNFKTVYIEILPPEEAENYWTVNWNYVIDLCPECFENKEAFEKLFGPVVVRQDFFGRHRNVVQLTNITDEGLHCGSLWDETIEMLKQIRDAKRIEDRLKLVKKNLF